MEKVYVYKNAIIRITIHNSSHENIRKATTDFLKKVRIERERDSKWRH
jgi:hypothetical protein